MTYATGRRKTSVARVYLSEGKGAITINGRDYKEYLNTPVHHFKVEQPIVLAELQGKYDIKVTVKGGGPTGQAEAIRLGIARSLVKIDPELRAVFKPDSLMTRNPRMVERKKFGQKKARKKFQFSKR